MLQKQLVILGLNWMGAWGAALIVYGMVCMMTDSVWAPLELIAGWLSAVFTLVALIATLLSVYWPCHTRSADKHSKVVVVPIVMLSVAIAMVLMCWKGAPLSTHATNGFAILALAGALFRFLPYSEWPPEPDEEKTSSDLG